MCTGRCLDDIIVCPSCKRDDEGHKMGEADSPFMDLGGGDFRCICGEVFHIGKHSQEIYEKKVVSP